MSYLSTRTERPDEELRHGADDLQSTDHLFEGDLAFQPFSSHGAIKRDPIDNTLASVWDSAAMTSWPFFAKRQRPIRGRIGGLPGTMRTPFCDRPCRLKISTRLLREGSPSFTQRTKTDRATTLELMASCAVSAWAGRLPVWRRRPGPLPLAQRAQAGHDEINAKAEDRSDWAELRIIQPRAIAFSV